ncbi:hypothetical protein Tsubulata_026125 [Turnera subulata]|uniref:B box-type domain-containing protein n=1 Tax=Turnera subulata TaxID=218843 RepID=A0A9Q0F7F2_9ROSI|nr:hypothetical protein Tsubulata_026125 [Turnera subulata]
MEEKHTMKKTHEEEPPLFNPCELCDQKADVYCDSDAALLCFRCDSKVHNANFLVARHLRRLLCPLCRSHLAGPPFSGAHRTPQAACPSCSPDDKHHHSAADDDALQLSSSSSASSASSTLSTTDTTSRTDATPAAGASGERRCKAVGRFEVEGSFVEWSRRLGLNGHLRGAVLSRASHALGCLRRGRLGGKAVLPFRVSLAASFWFGVRLCGDTSAPTWRNLKRVEQLSGVPAKVIVAVEVKLEHALRARRRRFAQSHYQQPQQDLEEGWAEC